MRTKTPSRRGVVAAMPWTKADIVGFVGLLYHAAHHRKTEKLFPLAGKRNGEDGRYTLLFLWGLLLGLRVRMACEIE